MWRKGLSSVLPSNAQLVLRKAIVETDLSPAINETTVFSTKLAVQQCAATSTPEAECKAEVVWLRMWNVSILMYKFTPL